MLRLKSKPLLERLFKENIVKFLLFKEIYKFDPTNP